VVVGCQLESVRRRAHDARCSNARAARVRSRATGRKLQSIGSR
jgi:hypothetical protein